MTDLQILAITRFAYPAVGGFQTLHETVAERQAHLWHPDRLAARFRTLEHVSLRTLASQSDDGFRTIILTGDALPEPWRSRLLSLASGLRGAEVVFHPPAPYRDALTDVIGPRIDRDGPPVMQFRHDDDDGVGRRFVARCREVFRDVRPFWERHGRLVVDFNRGMQLRLTAGGPLVKEMSAPHLGVAQALFLAPEEPRTALHFPHHKLGTLMPSVTLPDAPMWLRGVDGTNDSGIRNWADSLAPAGDGQLRQLTRRFALDLAAIRRSF